MSYSIDYDNPEIRSANYDVLKYLNPLLNKNMDVIDLGCGTCRKTIKFADKVKHIDGVEINSNMIDKAMHNINTSGVKNISVCNADNMDVPFVSHSYNLCVALLTTWSVTEAYRLLQENGILFIETLCSDDKKEVKEAFGKDEFGWRGRYFNQTNNERLKYLRLQIEPFFKIHSMDTISFKTTLTRDGFIKLLLLTPTIRGFSLSKDMPIIDKLISGGCINIFERRIIIVAQSRFNPKEF